MSDILKKSYKTYLLNNEAQQVNLHTYEAMIDKEVFDLYEIEGEDLEQILKEQGTPAGYFPIVEGFELIPEEMLSEAKEYVAGLSKIKLSPEELDSLGKKLTELYENGKSIEEISVELEINPVSVVAMRGELDLINQKDLKHEVENLLTHFILEELKEDGDGIIPLSRDMPEKTMTKRVIEDLEEMFGDDAVAEVLAEMKKILGKDLEGWLSKDFFKKHISQYKKRPIVWHLKSEKGYFEVFLYYHKLNSQTLQLLKNVYLSNLLDYNIRKVKELKEQQKGGSGGDSSTYKKIEEREQAIDDLKEFGEKLKGVMDLGICWVIDDGVLANIAPYQKAGLLAADVLDKNQLSKGLELLNGYIEERKAECKVAIKVK